MRKAKIGWTLLLAGALAIPSLSAAYAGKAKAAKADDAAEPAANLSKEDQERFITVGRLPQQWRERTGRVG